MMGLNEDIRLLMKERPHFQLPIKVHIDEFAAMNGVSRFGELRNSTLVQYSKEENLQIDERLKKFDRLLTGNGDIVKLSGGRFELRVATMGFHGIRNRIKMSKEKLKNMFLKIFERKQMELIELVEDVESIIEVEDDLRYEESKRDNKKERKMKSQGTKKQIDFIKILLNFMPAHIEMKEMVFHYSNQHIKRDNPGNGKGR